MMVQYSSRTGRVTVKGQTGNGLRRWTITAYAQGVDGPVTLSTKQPATIDDLKELIIEELEESGYNGGEFRFTAIAR